MSKGGGGSNVTPQTNVAAGPSGWQPAPDGTRLPTPPQANYWDGNNMVIPGLQNLPPVTPTAPTPTTPTPAHPGGPHSWQNAPKPAFMQALFDRIHSMQPQGGQPGQWNSSQPGIMQALQQLQQMKSSLATPTT